MKLRKREIMNMVKQDPRKFSALNIQLKVVIEKRPSRFEQKIPNESTEKFDLEKLLKKQSKSPRWPPLVTHKLPQVPTRSKNSTMGMTKKRVRRYAESHSGPRVSAESLIPTPRRQRTEDLIFGRGKVLGGEKGRALPIQYQECKYKLQNRLIQSIKKYDP